MHIYFLIINFQNDFFVKFIKLNNVMSFTTWKNFALSKLVAVHEINFWKVT